MASLFWLYATYLGISVFGLTYSVVLFGEQRRRRYLVTVGLFALDLVLLLLPEMWIIDLVVGLGLTGPLGATIASLLHRPSRWAIPAYGILVLLPWALIIPWRRTRSPRRIRKPQQGRKRGA